MGIACANTSEPTAPGLSIVERLRGEQRMINSPGLQAGLETQANKLAALHRQSNGGNMTKERACKQGLALCHADYSIKPVRRKADLRYCAWESPVQAVRR